MVPLFEEILRTKQVRSVDGSETLPLDSAISPDVGEFLQRLIRQRKPKTTLEVGLAFGVSALFICEALQECGGLHHIAIDAFQSTQWKSIGINNLKLAGFGNLIELRESYSHLALPELEAQGTRIDFAFIDGWHTFDSALTDFFHVDRLLSIGGVVVFDDAFFPGVHQACRYVATNRAYRVVATTELSRLPTTSRQRSPASSGRLGTPHLKSKNSSSPNLSFPTRLSVSRPIAAALLLKKWLTTSADGQTTPNSDFLPGGGRLPRRAHIC